MGDAISRVLTKLEGLKASQPDVEFIYKDTGAKKIGQRLDELNNLALTIGFQGQTALELYPDGKINVATVALFNEFGTQNMPARGFMRRAVSENLNEIQNELAVHFAKVVELRETPIEAMHAVGRFVAEKMVEMIDTAGAWAAPLAPSTVKAKGHADPLFETGLMKKSITWAVRTGGVLGSIVSEGQVS
jgi:HK97 gp10 family phage protein